ncbi:MAG: ArnT family glycosyltransferase [Thermodesulfobacteriota bacterium]
MEKEDAHYLILTLLLILSLFLNLGAPPLYMEEPRRALIALEMLYSGEYLTPTIMGELYFAKPPLFNWVILLSAKIFGSFSEMAVRFPTVVSLLLTGLANYLFVKKYLNKKVAFYSSLFFITSGNIYLYFSLLGEIDLFYALLVYLSIISIFYCHREDKIVRLFIYSFALAGMGFLTKGFPSIVFLYVSLIVFFAFEGCLKRFFSLYHLLGIAVFLLITGSYFFLYSLHNPIGPFLGHLWSESSGRTPLFNRMGTLLIHLIRFPLETLQSMLPYSLLLVFTLRRGFLREIFSTPLLKFSFLIFCANYSVYLISPGANQRYIYMLYPFAMVIFAHACFRYALRDIKRKALLGYMTIVAVALLPVAGFLLPILDISRTLPHVWLLSAAVITASILLLYLIARKREPILLFYLIALIALRLTLDMVYLPLQGMGSLTEKESNAARIAEITEGGTLLSYGVLDYGLIFYLERQRGEVLRRGMLDKENGYIIAKDSSLSGGEATEYYAFDLKGEKYRLVRFRSERESLPPTSLLQE